MCMQCLNVVAVNVSLFVLFFFHVVVKWGLEVIEMRLFYFQEKAARLPPVEEIRTLLDHL